MKIISKERNYDVDDRTCTVKYITSIGEFSSTATCDPKDNMCISIGYQLAEYKTAIKVNEQVLKNKKKEYKAIKDFVSTVDNIHTIPVETKNIMQKQLMHKQTAIKKLQKRIIKDKKFYSIYVKELEWDHKHFNDLYEKAQSHKKVDKLKNNDIMKEVKKC